MAHLKSRSPSEVNLKLGLASELYGTRWSRFVNSFIYHAAFEAVEKWAGEAGMLLWSSAILDTVDSSDKIIMDEYGDIVG